jgi:hypothetical protein
VLAYLDLLHLAERRRAPQRKAEIYATPGPAHLRRWRAHRFAAQRSLAFSSPGRSSARALPSESTSHLGDSIAPGRA